MPKQQIFVTGHKGMVGSAIVRRLERKKNIGILTAARNELNLLDQAAVQTWFENNPVDQVYICAAKVGGIHANNEYPTAFIPNMQNSHVIPALLRRFHEAKEDGRKQVTAWGTGKPMREFLHVDDMAAACVHLMELETETYQAHTQPLLSHINVGTGVDCTIRELTETVAKVVGFDGEIIWDTGKPDGTPRKLLDVSRLKALGWEASISLEDGLRQTYAWFLDNIDKFRE